MEQPSRTSRPHAAARTEDAVYRVLARWLRHRHWTIRVEPFTSYGGDGWVRVLARTVLAPVPASAPAGAPPSAASRGWRRFATAQVGHAVVDLRIGGRHHYVRADRGGYVDAVVGCELPPGLHRATLSSEGSAPVDTRVMVFDSHATGGIVSDVDDTVMVTNVPRPLLAAWNSLVRNENARQPVPGMAVLYDRLTQQCPLAPVFYLSTGAWNSEPALRRFLHRHGYPRGPLLLTDWGPTHTGWFRSGRDHKEAELRRLVADFPSVRWLLIGDDGQHDPEIYGSITREHPSRVRAIAIRCLTATQQVLAHGTPGAGGSPDRQPVPSDRSDQRGGVAPVLRGRDGTELRRLLERHSITLCDVPRPGARPPGGSAGT